MGKCLNCRKTKAKFIDADLQDIQEFCPFCERIPTRFEVYYGPVNDIHTEEINSILTEAEKLIHGARNETYGDATEDYTRTVGLFKEMYGDLKVSDLTAIHGMMFMVCVKLSREAHLHKRDNLLDAAGYLALIEEAHDPR